MSDISRVQAVSAQHNNRRQIPSDNTWKGFDEADSTSSVLSDLIENGQFKRGINVNLKLTAHFPALHANLHVTLA